MSSYSSSPESSRSSSTCSCIAGETRRRMSLSEEEVFESDTGFDFKSDCDHLINLLTVLSGERVSQMTRTYADADALQKLLEEKEKDLELAARIGQQLLEQNRVLEERVAALEAENKDNVDCITQLKHDLHFKTQLLELYNDTDSAENSKAGTPIGTTVATVLERRVAVLEDENKSLRSEAARIVEDVEKTEAEERYLVEDAIAKLSECTSQKKSIDEELHRKTEENITLQEEVVLLSEEVKIYQEANKELSDENLQLHKFLEELKTCRDELSTEIADMKDNYVEVVTLLKETQEQLRDAQKKKEGGADVVSVFDSLAYEIESSVARQRRSSDYFRRTFDTVRLANSRLSDNSMASSALMSSASSSGYLSGTSGLPSLECSQDASHLQGSLVLSGSDLGSSICHTPAGSTPGSWKLPEKLQIVKPLEGSSTLQVWSALATPHLGNLLDKRPGVQMRVERPVGEMGMQAILSLSGAEPTVLHNVISTPAVFTFVTTTTTTTSRERSEGTSTVFSTTTLSSRTSLSSSGVYSRVSPSPLITSVIPEHDSPARNLAAIMPPCSSPSSPRCVSSSSSVISLHCETPKNSPVEGNTRAGSPTPFSHRHDDQDDDDDPDATATPPGSQTMKKTLYSFYDSVCSKLVGLASPSYRNLEYAGSPQKYDLTTKLGRVEVAFESSRLCAPVKPGTGALDKILFESGNS